MSITTKVLAFLNILVSLVVLALGTQSYYARIAWNNQLLLWQKARDGDNTDVVLSQFADKKPNLLTEMKEDKGNPTEAFDSQRRRLAQLLLSENEAATAKGFSLAKEYGLGPDDIRGVLYYHLHNVRSRLAFEERQMERERRDLIALRERWTNDIQKLEAENKKILGLEQLQGETNKAIQAGTRQRREHLAQLLVQFQESIASRDLAENRERDMIQDLKDRGEEYDQLYLKNFALERELQRRERVATGIEEK